MGLFDFIFGKPVTIEHPFFGTMTFIGGKTPGPDDYFESRRIFRPSGKIIEVLVEGEVSGPTQKQVDFFKYIEDNYEVIKRSAAPLIEDLFGNWKEGFKIGDFDKEFEPAFIDLPRCETQPVQWELHFESDHDRNHVFIATMQDLRALELNIDG